MEFIIDHQPKIGHRLCVRIYDNVEETAKDISTLYPGESLNVVAYARVRMVVKDGDVVRNFPELDHMYDLTDNPIHDRARHEWYNCIGGTEDPGEL